jgi:glycerophosphoryl diester phosphodiesterase
MFGISQGTDLFGDQVAVRTSPGTISVLTDEHAAFSVLESACLPDRRVVVEGYWQYPLDADAGLLRVFVDPPELAERFCSGEAPPPTTDFELNGHYGNDSDFPRKPIKFTFRKELQPWRGRFLTTAHHGACEGTDHCGASPNSLESIRLAERIGSNAAELDVRITRDGFPILFHDPGLSKSLVRGTFCNGQVAELSLPELLGACELRYGELIPTVEEALEMMVDETELEAAYLDMKVPGAVLPAARLVSQLNARLRERNTNADLDDDRHFTAAIAITTEEVRTAWHDAKDALTKEGLEIPACLLEYDPDLVLSEHCVAWGPTWTEGPKVDDVKRLQDKGVATIFWTINQSEFIKDFLVQANPHGIVSARAAMLFYLYQTVGTPPPVINNQAP